MSNSSYHNSLSDSTDFSTQPTAVITRRVTLVTAQGAQSSVITVAYNLDWHYCEVSDGDQMCLSAWTPASIDAAARDLVEAAARWQRWATLERVTAALQPVEVVEEVTVAAASLPDTEHTLPLPCRPVGLLHFDNSDRPACLKLQAARDAFAQKHPDITPTIARINPLDALTGFWANDSLDVTATSAVLPNWIWIGGPEHV